MKQNRTTTHDTHKVPEHSMYFNNNPKVPGQRKGQEFYGTTDFSKGETRSEIQAAKEHFLQHKTKVSNVDTNQNAKKHTHHRIPSNGHWTQVDHNQKKGHDGLDA